MKALTLTQPWATLVAVGAKTLETRSWGTRHRGLIAIHAAKEPPADLEALSRAEPFYTALRHHDGGGGALSVGDSLPRGAIIAIASVTACHRSDSPTVEQLLRARPRRERRFGDFSSGRWVWVLDDVRQVESPLPCRGTLGLWEVPESMAAIVDARTQAAIPHLD